MGDKTGIEWTDATWNPVTGCTKVSPGCDHCYAEKITERFHGKGSFADVKLHPERLDMPLRWRKAKRVFVNSMSDLFHDAIPDDYIAQVYAVMALSPRHTFQVLTKRHGRMRSLLNSVPFWDLVGRHVATIYDSGRGEDPGWAWGHTNEPFNVWLGVSVENQTWADVRIRALLCTPAAVRFLSCEPLLGPIDLSPDGLLVDWVIVGGESGPGARPMHPDWARSLRDQCAAAEVPFLFKQWGEWQNGSAYPGQKGPNHIVLTDGRHDDAVTFCDGTSELHRSGERGSPTYMARVGKKAAGRELDGRTWDEFPAVAL